MTLYNCADVLLRITYSATHPDYMRNVSL